MRPTVIKSHIVFHNGEAIIAGRGNLKAEYVARRHVAGGDPIDAVMDHYGLTRAEVYAALAYYYDNQAALDAEYARAFTEGRQQGALDSVELEARIRARMQADDE